MKKAVDDYQHMDAMAIESLKLEATYKAFQKRLKWQQEHGVALSKQLYTKAMADYFIRTAQARQNGKTLAYTSVAFFPELLHAMDVVNFAPTQYAIQIMVQGNHVKYIQKGLQTGLSTELCSCITGAAGMVVDGLFPEPDLILATGQQPCDSATIEAELFKHHWDVPFFWYSIPSRRDERTAAFLREQFEEMVEFVEQHSSNRYDETRMREVMEHAKVAHSWYTQTQELRMATPCPLRSRDSRQIRGLRTFLDGRPETGEALQAQYEETREKVEKGEGAIPNERHRLVVNGVPPFWNMKLFDWMEETFGAVIVVDLCNRFYPYDMGSTSDPLDCLARKVMNYNMKAGIDTSVVSGEELAYQAKKAQCDSSIYFAHFGCKVGCGAAKVTTDTIREIIDVPSVILDIDAYDPRVVSDQKMKAVLTEYFETLEASRKSFALAGV